MLFCEGYEMFQGVIRITPVNNMAPFDEEGTVLYRPDTGCYYVNGHSFDKSIVTIMEDNTKIEPLTEEWVMIHCFKDNRHESVPKHKVNEIIQQYEKATLPLKNKIPAGNHIIYAIKHYDENGNLEKVYLYNGDFIVDNIKYATEIIPQNPNCVILSHD